MNAHAERLSTPSVPVVAEHNITKQPHSQCSLNPCTERKASGKYHRILHMPYNLTHVHTLICSTCPFPRAVPHNYILECSHYDSSSCFIQNQLIENEHSYHNYRCIITDTCIRNLIVSVYGKFILIVSKTSPSRKGRAQNCKV